MTTDLNPHRGASMILRPSDIPVEQGLEEVQHPAMAAAGIGLVGYGLYKRGIFGLFSVGVGVGMVAQWLATNHLIGTGAKRTLLNLKTTRPARFSASITVERTIDAVYAQWRDLEQLPRFMEHVESVQQVGTDLYRWRARIPKTHETVEWTARIIEDIPGQRIVWRSIEGSDIHNQGVVEFRRGPHAGQTEVLATIEFRPPAGAIGAKVSEFLHAVPEQFVKENLRNFKHVIEAGELPTIKGQPSGRVHLN